VPFMISWVCVALFNVSMISGLILAFVYKPSVAYESVQKITYIVPYGNLFRELHYFSSEAFLVFTLIHIILELSKSKFNISQSSWNYSILALILLFFLMFTGYVLKADLSGLSAGEVALSLLKQTPFLSNLTFLFEDSSFFIWKFYIWHILFLPIILVYAVYVHVKSFKTKYFIIGLGISVLSMIVFKMPNDVLPSAIDIHVQGPWFFRGAENLLMLGISPVLVNITIAIPFVLLFIYFYKEKFRKFIGFCLILWSALYASFYLI